jgi:hypothetical protein
MVEGYDFDKQSLALLRAKIDYVDVSDAWNEASDDSEEDGTSSTEENHMWDENETDEWDENEIDE